MILFVLLIGNLFRQLDHGLCVERHCESTYHDCDLGDFIHLDYAVLPHVTFTEHGWVTDGMLEYDIGIWQLNPIERYDPIYYVRLQSGDRNEWIEVQEYQYNQAVPGEFFDLR